MEMRCDKLGDDNKRNVDKRVVRTKKAIKSALFRIMESKALNEITISELTAAANVNRRTFYTHYHNLTDILEEIETDLVAELKALLESVDPSDHKNSIYNIFIGFYKLMSGEFDYYFHLMRMDTRGILTSRMRNALKASAKTFKDHSEIKEATGIIPAFEAGGFLACFMEWYYSEDRIPVEKAAEIVSIMAEACAKAAMELK